MDIINWIKEDNKNTALAFFIVEAMVEVDDTLAMFRIDDKFDGEKIELEVKINGVEVPAKHAFDLLEEHILSIETKFRDQLLAEVKLEFAQKLADDLQTAISKHLDIDRYEL